MMRKLSIELSRGGVLLDNTKGYGTLSKKKNDIIWEFFPNVDPHPPLLGTPYPKKIFSVYFAF